MKRSLFSKGLCFALAIGALGIAGGVVGSSAATEVNAATVTWEKVTSELTDWSGDYLIVYEDSSTSGSVFDGSLASNQIDSGNNFVTVPIDSNVIADSQTIDSKVASMSSYKFTIAASTTSGKYSIKSANGFYIGRDTNSNGFDTSTTTSYDNEISYSGSSVSIAGSGGPKLQFFVQKGSDSRYRYYKSSQKAIQLYKYTETISYVVSGAAYGGSTLVGTAFSAEDFTFNVTENGTTTSVNGTNTDVVIATDASFSNVVKDGSTTVFATAGDVNLYYKYKDTAGADPLVVKVSASAVNVESVTLAPTSATAYIGTPITLTATVLPENATNKAVSWTSSDTNVATVADGLVTPLKAGNTTITVTTVDQGKTATCAVEVKEDTANSLQISGQTTDFAIDDPFVLGEDVVITASMASGKTETPAASDCTYTLNGTSISLNATLATAGKHTIVVSYKGATATYQISVVATMVFEVTNASSGTLTAPTGVSATFKNTYDGNVGQITGDNSQTLTLSGLSGYKITGLILHMRSNSRSGAGTLSYVVDGGESVTICSGAYNTAFSSAYTSSYENVSKTLSTPIEGDSVVFTMACTTSSIYCNSWTFLYEKVAIVDTLEITKAPTKTSYYEGQTFDPAGMEVVAHMSDDTSPVITDYTMDPDTTTPLTTAHTSIKISYKGASVEQAITVTARTLNTITLDSSGAKTTYSFGEKIDYTGLKVTANYTEGDPVELNLDAVTFSVASGTIVTKAYADAGSIDVEVSYGGKSADLTLTVNAADAVFTKVTSAADLEIGATYALAYDAGEGEALPLIAKSDNHAYYSVGTATYTDGTYFLDNDTVLGFTLAPGSASGKYALWSDTENGYLYGTSGSSDPDIESTFSSGDLEITFDEDGTANILSNGRYIGYNYNNGSNPRFAFYASSSTYPVCLYKRYEASNTAFADATSWASSFLSNTASYCEAGTIEDNWATALGTVPSATLAKDFLVRGAVDSSTIGQALARYDYIVGKYANLNDPLNRKGESGASPAARNSLDNGENTAMIAMASILGIGLGTGAVVILARKKKRVR